MWKTHVRQNLFQFWYWTRNCKNTTGSFIKWGLWWDWAHGGNKHLLLVVRQHDRWTGQTLWHYSVGYCHNRVGHQRGFTNIYGYGMLATPCQSGKYHIGWSGIAVSKEVFVENNDKYGDAKLMSTLAVIEAMPSINFFFIYHEQ